ncbi:hypothetical protein Tco_0706814 [Tanacetum coccineum]|uniref:Uncharacterized protein n=1 Tax=Tanacetum coccineum TaxID=301880 RepID=A0ABQ4YA29_9ASTR
MSTALYSTQTFGFTQPLSVANFSSVSVLISGCVRYRSAYYRLGLADVARASTPSSLLPDSSRSTLSPFVAKNHRYLTPPDSLGIYRLFDEKKNKRSSYPQFCKELVRLSQNVGTRAAIQQPINLLLKLGSPAPDPIEGDFFH